MADTKVVTGKVRLSFVSVFKRKPKNDGTEGKYELQVLVPKSDKATVKKIKAAIEEATQQGIDKYKSWGGKAPKGFMNPLHDGDADDEDLEKYPEREGMYYLNARSDKKPGIVDRDCNEILDPDEVYSGCWGRVSVNFYPFDNQSRGVGVGLNNVQKLKDDTRLGGSAASAEDDFGDGFEDDEDDF